MTTNNTEPLINPFRSHLSLAGVLVGLICTALLLYYYQQHRAARIEYSLQKARVIALQIATAQSSVIEQTHTLLRRLVQAPAVHDPTSSSCRDHIRQLLRQTPMLINIGVPTAEGELLCNALPLKKNVNVADRGYFQRSLQQRTFAMGEFQQDRAAEVISVNFSYPVIDAGSDRVEGVAVAVVSLQWWSDRLNDYKLPAGSISFITDANGSLVAHYPNSPSLLGRPATLHGIKQLHQRGDEVSAEIIVGADGIHRAFAHRPLYSNELGKQATVSVGIPLDYSETAIGQWMNRILQFLLVVIATIALLSLRLRLQRRRTVSKRIHDSVGPA